MFPPEFVLASSTEATSKFPLDTNNWSGWTPLSQFERFVDAECTFLRVGSRARGRLERHRYNVKAFEFPVMENDGVIDPADT